MRSALEHDATPLSPPKVVDLLKWVFSKVTGIKLAGGAGRVSPAALPPQVAQADGPGTELVPLGAAAGGGDAGAGAARAAEGGGAGGSEYHRRTEELSAEASPVAAQLSGAFATLAALAEQQREMIGVLSALDDRVMRRRARVAALAEEFNAVDGGDRRRGKH